MQSSRNMFFVDRQLLGDYQNMGNSQKVKINFKQAYVTIFTIYAIINHIDRVNVTSIWVMHE